MPCGNTAVGYTVPHGIHPTRETFTHGKGKDFDRWVGFVFALTNCDAYLMFLSDFLLLLLFFPFLVAGEMEEDNIFDVLGLGLNMQKSHLCDFWTLDQFVW